MNYDLPPKKRNYQNMKTDEEVHCMTLIKN
ncbi:Uncharacterised protein [Salmonella enterica subsp. indica]|uniref:Uncharacterized protein n=1 Tax=Salmonella enterica subsp. indica TaxID=59207 RepID=A0A379XME7_SALER|nr:Uncharacterised protein [Salmonella enterica subsp. indica]